MVSEINPFLFGHGSAVCCPVTAEAKVVLDFLDLFPIWAEFATVEKLFTRDKMNVMRRIDGKKPSMEDLCQSIYNGRLS